MAEKPKSDDGARVEPRRVARRPCERGAPDVEARRVVAGEPLYARHVRVGISGVQPLLGPGCAPLMARVELSAAATVFQVHGEERRRAIGYDEALERVANLGAPRERPRRARDDRGDALGISCSSFRLRRRLRPPALCINGLLPQPRGVCSEIVSEIVVTP